MSFKLSFLITDILFCLLVFAVIIFIFWVRRYEHLLMPWRQVFAKPVAIISATILAFYITIGFLDSIHFQIALTKDAQGRVYYSSVAESLLDYLIIPQVANEEKTYSMPFATTLYTREAVPLNSHQEQIYPKLKFGGRDLEKLNRSQLADILIRTVIGGLLGLLLWFFIIIVLIGYQIIRNRWRRKITINYRDQIKNLFMNKKFLAFITTLLIIFLITGISLVLSNEYHIFGTDQVGNDVFYQSVKSIRTGLIIGTLTTIFMLPFAIFLGTLAGYFGGAVDDIIQYIYTTLSSIPGVLLIAASILSLQIFISNHPDLFATISSRADIRLLALCLILGVTSWTSLCRLLRGETLKLREMDYILAARALGVNHFKIVLRHLIPNVMHIVLITIVLDFSSLVLAEAVLTYVGVGVDPTTFSWGNMINSARLELAREPIVWWPLGTAFIFMFILVLAANLFADAVRDAFDPRIRMLTAEAK